MSKFGFVYILSNESMPGLYKIGCTERSPHARAAELSRATGVPAPFEVLCYIEVEDHQREERVIHERLKESRSSTSREFFTDLRRAALLLLWHPDRINFFNSPGEFGGGVLELIEGDDFHPYNELSDLPDPWSEDQSDSRHRGEVNRYLRHEANCYRAKLRGELMDRTRDATAAAKKDANAEGAEACDAF